MPRPPSIKDPKDKSPAPARRRMRGFETAAKLVDRDIRKAAEGRGFAVSRLLTNWAEIVGAEFARATRPVKVSHGKGFGATLTILVRGAEAPLIQMQAERIRERVNACYGFNAVSRIAITQTAASGFADGQASFAAAPVRPPAPSPERLAEAEALAAGFTDPALAAAIRGLTLNLLSRRDANDRKAK